MPKTTEPEYGVPDEENPEWTQETFARAKRAHEIPEIHRLLQKMKRDGLKAIPEKTPITIPLDADVLDALQATGPDWQKKAEEALREKFVKSAA